MDAGGFVLLAIAVLLTFAALIPFFNRMDRGCAKTTAPMSPSSIHLWDCLNRRAIYVLWAAVAVIGASVAALPLGLLAVAVLAGLVVRFALVPRAVVESVAGDALVMWCRGQRRVLEAIDIHAASRVYAARVYPQHTPEYLSPVWHLRTKGGFWPWTRGYLVVDADGDERLTGFLESRHLVRWN